MPQQKSKFSDNYSNGKNDWHIQNIVTRYLQLTGVPSAINSENDKINLDIISIQRSWNYKKRKVLNIGMPVWESAQTSTLPLQVIGITELSLHCSALTPKAAARVELMGPRWKHIRNIPGH